MIDEFDGEYRFLSNFSYEGAVSPTVEHHYQAWKATYPAEAWKVMEYETPGQAKKAGRRILLRPDWEDIKLQVMMDLLMWKFQAPEIQKKLLATGDTPLVEGNYWHDTYWGVCNGEGENWLGKLLEVVREIYASKEKFLP